MRPDIVMLHTERRPDELYMIPDDSNTLTLQSYGTNYDPRDPPPQARYRNQSLIYVSLNYEAIIILLYQCI